MISVESHSKQMKLLNEYIIALEKQIASSRKENEELQKNTSDTAKEMKVINEELNRQRN
jgi:cell division protein FtsB